MRVEVWGRDYCVVDGAEKHFVTNERGELTCSCGTECSATGVVALYLSIPQNPRATHTYNRTKGPSLCPICGGRTRPWPHSYSYKRWRCDAGAYAHYFHWRILNIKDISGTPSTTYNPGDSRDGEPGKK